MDWKLVWAIILLPFVAVAKLLKSRAGLILVVVVGVTIFLAVRPSPAPTGSAALPYNQNLPSVKVAPVAIQTSSRVYYVSKYTDDGKVLTLTLFYYYDKDRWTKTKIPLSIDRGIYGN